MAKNAQTGPGGGNGDFGNWDSERLDLTTKVAVVTGGARGIGAATCVELARSGIRAVAVVDAAEDLPQVTGSVNERLNRKVLFPYRGDVTDSAFRREVFRELRKDFGVVSICVPAAGITRDRLAVKYNRELGRAEIYPEEDFRRVLEVDLTAPVYWAMETIATVAEDRARRGLRQWEPSERIQGCIIFIGSVSSAGNRGQVSYAAAKAGLEGAQATLAAEAAYHGLRCAIIHPGFTDTAMVAALGEEFIRENILPQTQLRRLITPGEIAHAIVFMIQNSAVSGQLRVDAGWRPRV